MFRKGSARELYSYTQGRQTADTRTHEDTSMNKLWLSAITAACLLAGNAAHAGDHGGWHDNGRHRGWDNHREYRRCDDDRWAHRDHWHRYDRDYRDVYYSRPVYYSLPVYYERPARGYYDDDFHGSISVNF